MKTNRLTKQILAISSICILGNATYSQTTTNSNTLNGTYTNAPNQYLGSANNYDVLFKANSVERMRIAYYSGNIGLGTTNPLFNLQVNGTTDYIQASKYGDASINYGKTSRLGLTNTTCGALSTDGTQIRQSANNFAIENQEDGEIRLNTGSIVLALNGINGATTLNTNGTTTIKATGLSATANVFVVQNSTRKLLQLTNDGILRSREIIVDQLNWADYVFKPEYKLMPLAEVEAYVVKNGHLPNIKSAEEVAKEGLNINETTTKLMEKIEELTLYLIEQQKIIDGLKTQISEMKSSQ